MSSNKIRVNTFINNTVQTALYSLAVAPLCCVMAEENLDTIDVFDSTESVYDHRVGETVKTSDALSKKQVSNSRDLVRYETGITVVETGRMGTSGYAIRGVDENRVGILIDGLRQSETLSSQGFKELFGGYGNFNNTRNSTELENIKSVTLVKGSDSSRSGGGALGGSVLFETKDARDYLIDKNYYVGLKTGYRESNDQHLGSLTLAGKYKDFDALLIHTKRKGHERRNHFYNVYKTPEEDNYAIGRTRKKTDPYNIDRTSTLIKFAYQPYDEHRFEVALDDSLLKSDGRDLSYVLRTNPGEEEKYGHRLTDDKSQRRNVSFKYENFTETPVSDSIKVTYSSQTITNNARTDELCVGERCQGTQNPAGLKLDSSTGVYKVVDRYGKDIVARKDGKYGTYFEYTDSKGNSIYSDVERGFDVNNTFLNCDELDCSKKFRVFNKNTVQFEDRTVTVKETQGVRYGEIEKVGTDSIVLLPKTRGYNQDLFNDRDLNSDTKQINVDVNKELTIRDTDHRIKYGMLYGLTEKSMVNKDGYIGQDPQWWATNFFCGKIPHGEQNIKIYPDHWPSGGCYIPKDNTAGRSSYLIPVTTKNTAFYVGDSIRVNDWLGLDVNYRYDVVEHSPGYDANVPVPKGLLTGILEPLPDTCDRFAINAYNSDCINENFNKNLNALLQDTSYKHHSYNLGVNVDPTPWLRMQFKYSNGFRAPTSDEVYMTFKHPSFSITPNPSLKAEVAKTKELAFTFHKDNSFIRLGAFQTDYDNFIDLVYAGERPIEIGGNPKDYRPENVYPFYTNINRDSARVQGFEIQSLVNIGDFYPKLKGFRVGYKFMHQKGRMDGDIPMNAIQPDTSVFSIGYSSEDDTFGADLFVKHVAAKEAFDTYNMYWEGQKKRGAMVNGKPVTDSTVAWRNDSYTVLDAVGYLKPNKNTTFTLGVYNLTDESYMTWDSARSIRSVGTINMIDQNSGAGIERFTAPGRNVRFTAEIKF